MPAIRLVCPRCRHDLITIGDSLACGSCHGTFQVVSGIPDLRVASDPWIDPVAERSRLPGFLTPLVPVYHAFRRVPVVSRVCRAVAPLLDAQGVAP